jgi:hypothetical protein
MCLTSNSKDCLNNSKATGRNVVRNDIKMGWNIVNAMPCQLSLKRNGHLMSNGSLWLDLARKTVKHPHEGMETRICRE